MCSLYGSNGESNENFTKELINDIKLHNNIFITGPAGSGKSSLLLSIADYFRDQGKKVTVVSSTGISAINVKGKTIHSWAGIRLGKENYGTIYERIKNNQRYKENWKTDILICDELPMIGRKTMELISKVGCLMRKNQQPFGGIIMIFSGDFLQLPPINDSFCFSSELWKQLNLKVVRLTHSYRFPDQRYFELLSRARIGKLNEEDVSLLKNREDAYKKYITNL